MRSDSRVPGAIGCVLFVPALARSCLGPSVSHLRPIPSINLPSREKLLTMTQPSSSDPSGRDAQSQPTLGRSSDTLVLLETESVSGSVWLSLGSDVWGQVQGPGLVCRQGIKPFPEGDLE